MVRMDENSYILRKLFAFALANMIRSYERRLHHAS